LRRLTLAPQSGTAPAEGGRPPNVEAGLQFILLALSQSEGSPAKGPASEQCERSDSPSLTTAAF